MITIILMINPLQQEQDIRKRAAKEREIPIRKWLVLCQKVFR
jgi:hypothetical protein